MAQLNVALVGCGWVSASHMAEGFAVLPDRFQVIACCDVDAARAERFAAEHGVPRAVTRFEDVLAMPDVEVVDICTPPMLHFDMVLAALRAGKHVICEKPFTSSLEKLDEIVAVEAGSPGRVMPIFQYRFGPGLAKVRHAIRSGLVGRAFVSSVETMWLRESDYYEVQWRGKFASELGGVLLTQAVHMHDLLLWLMGPAAAVAAFKTTRVNPVEVEDCAVASLQMADGSLASLSCTLGSVKPVTRFRLCFENATFERLCEGRGQVGRPGEDPWLLFPKTEEIGRAIEAKMAEAPEVRSRFGGQFDGFYDALQSGAAFPVTMEDARRSLELITALFYSNETGAAVHLPIGPDHRRYRGWVPAETEGVQ
jgi:predicted dehydrogenase